MQTRILSLPIMYLLLFHIFPILLNAQEGVSSYENEFEWNEADKTETILIDVEKGSDVLMMNFVGNISDGELDLTAFDPDGNKAAGFSLVTVVAEGVQVFVESGDGDNVISISNSSSGSSYSSSSDSGSGSNINIVTSGSDASAKSISVSSSGKNKSKNKNKDKKKSKDKSANGYTVTTTNSDARTSKGVMNKTIIEPAAGQWKIVLKVQNVTGTFIANIDQD